MFDRLVYHATPTFTRQVLLSRQFRKAAVTSSSIRCFSCCAASAASLQPPPHLPLAGHRQKKAREIRLRRPSRTAAVMAASDARPEASPPADAPPPSPLHPNKLHGRAFYESIGSPKFILAPMVDQSEFAWRLLTRSFLPPRQRANLLAYSPMFHAKLFADSPKYRAAHFEPLRPPLALPQPADPHHQNDALHRNPEDLYLDGNPAVGDRPLFVQFCANDPAAFLAAAQLVAPHCDAVDLNLGCPQGIARRGGYGAFLQEDWPTISELISTLHQHLPIPVTAKFRIQETREKTLAYARMILASGASILTVHGRQRHQKGHATGLAEWSVIRYLRDNLPPDTVIFANGNVLQYRDLQRCLDATGADGVMSAEGNLYDPGIFAEVAAEEEAQEGDGDGRDLLGGVRGREYWRGRDGKGGWRVDAVLRRYLDIIHEHVLRQAPPRRQPLFLPEDEEGMEDAQKMNGNGTEESSAGLDSTSNGAGEKIPSETDPAATTTADANGIHDSSNNRTADDDDDAQISPPSKRQKHTHTATESSSQQPPTPPSAKTQQQQQQKQPRQKPERCTNPNLVAMQAHCFHILRALVGVDHGVRDALARSRAGDIAAYEHVLALTEAAVREGLREYKRRPEGFEDGVGGEGEVVAVEEEEEDEMTGESSAAAVRRCKRPFWICQSRVRPLPKEALEKGSLQLSKKERQKLAEEEERNGGVVAAAEKEEQNEARPQQQQQQQQQQSEERKQAKKEKRERKEEKWMGKKGQEAGSASSLPRDEAGMMETQMLSS